MKVPLFLVCFSLFAAFSVSVKRQLLAPVSTLASLPIGKAMPDFTMTDTRGRQFSLNDAAHTHKVVLVNFWGTWCGPCRIEMPSFQKMYAENEKNGFLILAIDEHDTREELDTYLKQKPVTFPILLDPDGAFAKRLGVESFPTSVLVGKDGMVFQVSQDIDQSMEFIIRERLKDSSMVTLTMPRIR